MQKLRKASIFIALILIMNLLLYSCTQKDAGAVQTTTKAGTNSSTNTTAATTEETVKLRLFMSDSGTGVPEDIDFKTLEYITYLNEYANVELDIEIPVYQDFQTRQNLMLASGDIADIVHSWFFSEMKDVAQAGGFIDLMPYYENSKIMQARIPPEALPRNVADDGVNYHMPMAWKGVAGNGIFVRHDILEQVYGGKEPETVDGWVDFVRTVKNEIPNSIPLSSSLTGDRIMVNQGSTFWRFFGINNPYSYRVYPDKVVHDFTLPEYKEALVLWQQLYDEGILDMEFAVQEQSKFNEKRNNNKVAMITVPADHVPAFLSIGDEFNWLWRFIDPLKEYPSVLEHKDYAVFDRLSMPTLNKSHGVYISSNSKYPDRAWRVMEGLASPGYEELLQVAYTNPETTYSLGFAFLIGFPSITFSPVTLDGIREKVGDRNFNISNDSRFPLQDRAEKFGIDFWLAYQRDGSDEDKAIRDLTAEADRFITSVISNVIMGRMSIDEFDQKVIEFKSKFGSIAQYHTKKLLEQKDELLEVGVKFDLLGP